MTQFGFTKKQIKMIEVIVLLNAMALSILLPTAQSTGEIPKDVSCYTPPNPYPFPYPNGGANFTGGNIPHPTKNPNPCHSYLWNNYPITDFGITPRQGLFNNDTSYYFEQNVTSFGAFAICYQELDQMQNGQQIGAVNTTITLQYLNGSLSWNNVAVNGAGGTTIGGGDGGSVTGLTDEPDQPSIRCSAGLGYMPNNFAQLCTGISPNCFLRIAGNNGCCNLGQVQNPFFLQLTEFDILFFNSPIKQNPTIVCTSTNRSLASFINTCSNSIPVKVSTAVTVSWRATNSTGGSTSCGVNDNCWRPTGNPGSLTCTIPIGSATCVNTGVPFSPAFTTTTPIVIEDWSPVTTGGIVTTQPPTIKTLLP